MPSSGDSIPDITTPGFHGHIGLARADITPPPGVPHRNWGCASHETAEGVHRPLLASVLTLHTLDAAGPPLVFLDLDLGWWRDRDEPDRLRARVLHDFGLPDSHLLLALTHTHAGPVLSRSPAHPVRDAWLDSLPDRLAGLVRDALASAAPATLAWTTARCALATNRDLPEPGTDRFLCGFHPGHPADDTLLVGRITDPTGHLRAVWVNYACHPTTLGGGNCLLSPDYPGALRETIEQATGGLCLFLLGACGDLAPARQYLDDPLQADAHGRALAHAALGALELLPPAGQALRFAGSIESGAPLALWQPGPHPASTLLHAERADLLLPFKPDLPRRDDIDRQLSRPDSLDPFALERLRRLRGVRSMFGDGANASEALWAWRIGDACLFASPFEAYSVFQTTLRTATPSPVLVGNVVNGWRGYLAPASHYARNQYAVWQSPFAAGGLEQLTETTLRILTSWSTL